MSQKKVNITTQQKQFLQSKNRGTIFIGGVGSGKTRILCTQAVLKALNGRRFCIVSFSYPMLRDVVLETLKSDVLPSFGLVEGKDYTINKSDMIVSIRGVPLLLRSGDRPDSLRGLNLHDFGIDEAREFPDDSIFMVMLGRMRKSHDGQWYISTTPKGTNWVHDLMQDDWEPESRDYDVRVIRQTTMDNPFLPIEYINELKKRYTSEFARQELYGECVDFNAGVIDPSWYKIVDPYPPVKGVRFWDMAVSVKSSADYTAGALCSIKDDFVIHDMVHMKAEYPDVRKKIIETAHNDGRQVQIVVEEAGQQRGFIDDLKRIPELRGYVIRTLKPHGDKYNRAMPWASRAELGNVKVCRGTWNKQFFDECKAFTADDSHKHDDQIDAVSGAYTELTNKSRVVPARIRI